MAKVDALSRLRGLVIGGALGDAVGLAAEGLSRPQCIEAYGRRPRFTLEIPPPAGMHGRKGDRHRSLFEEGAWTDDTDQSLLILMSFLRSGGSLSLDPVDFAKRLRFWVQFGFRPLDRLPLGIGKTVGSVVRSASYVEKPVETATSVWKQLGGQYAANGAVMRTAIIGGLLYQGDLGITRTMDAAIEIARTSHADPRCLVSCAILSGLVAALMREELHSDQDIKNIVELSITQTNRLDPPLPEKHIEELNGYLWKDHIKDLHLDERESIGYTYKCLAAAVWALRKALNPPPTQYVNPASRFEKIIATVIMAGGDTDTNACVAGSLLGVLNGYEALPAHWVKHLAHHDWLMQKTNAAAWLIFKDTDKSGLSPYDPTSDEDTLVDGGKGEMTNEELDSRWKELITQSHIRMGDIDKDFNTNPAQDEKDKCVTM